MFKVSYFLEVLPIIASKVNITFELTVAATIFALIVGVIIAIIGYYKIPVLYQLTRVYVSIMRGTPVVAQLYFFYYGIALYSAFVRNMTPVSYTHLDVYKRQAMIGVAAYYEYMNGTRSGWDLNAVPNLKLGER